MSQINVNPGDSGGSAAAIVLVVVVLIVLVLLVLWLTGVFNGPAPAPNRGSELFQLFGA